MIDMPLTGARPLPNTVRAVVVTGASTGSLGMFLAAAPVPVVVAAGKTPEEVVGEVQDALRATDA